MANSNYAIPNDVSTIALTTSLAHYQPRLADNVYNQNVITKLLSQNKRLINGGLSIVERVIKEKQNDGGFYLGADVLNNVQRPGLGMVEFPWQNLYEPITVTRDEERQNAGEAHKVIDLVGTKIELSERAAADRLEQALSTPIAEANNLNSLEDIVGTGDLGNIAGATQTWWQSTSTASGAFATQGLSDMTTATYAVSSASEMDSPTHYIMGKAAFMRFEQTRLPLERISSGSTANAGFTNFTFKGKPVIYGNYIRAGLIFGININYIYLAVDSATDFVTTPFISPTNQTVKVAYILWRGNLVTNNRRRHFVLTGST